MIFSSKETVRLEYESLRESPSPTKRSPSPSQYHVPSYLSRGHNASLPNLNASEVNLDKSKTKPEKKLTIALRSSQIFNNLNEKYQTTNLKQVLWPMRRSVEQLPTKKRFPKAAYPFSNL
jgi:hypothetical protein